MKVRIATIHDLEAVIDHELAHMKELGFNNLPAHPFPINHQFDREQKTEQKKESWGLDLSVPGWSRSFLLLTDDNKIIGHLGLKNVFLATLHRAELGMGIDSLHRSKGGGKLLMSHALKWAQNETNLEWIDLCVFAHNLPAKALYTSFGFQEMCTIHDLFRVEGVSIDDTKMNLRLNRSSI